MLIGQVFVFLDPDGSMQVKPSETLKWLKKTSLVMSDKTTLNDQQRPDVSCKAFTEYITQGSQRKKSFNQYWMLFTTFDFTHTVLLTYDTFSFLVAISIFWWL